jgi:hypothetical protein
MKKHILSVLFLAASLASFSQDKVVVNDKNAQQRNVGSGFSEISVSGGIDLYLSPDDHEVVVVSATELKYRDRIVTRVVGNKLEIYFDGKGIVRWPDNMKLKAYVSFRALSNLHASGASDVFVNGVIRSENFDLHLSGSSDFSGAFRVGQFNLQQSGASDSRISGTAEKFKVHVSGSSDVKAYDFSVNFCEAEASGASDIQVTVNKEISARASGSSDINYRGDGLIRDVKTSGASSVSRKG